MNNYCMNHDKKEARQKAVRQLRLAHARHMEAFDRYLKEGNLKEAHYWLTRASETHQRLLDLGEVAI